METKICCKCKLIKEISFFSKDKYSKDGLTYSCKLCKKKQDKESNKNKMASVKDKEIKNEWRNKNKEKIKEYRKKNYEINKEKILSQNKIYWNNNLSKIKERKKKYYLENKDKRKIREDIKLKTNPLFKLTITIRSRIKQFLKQRGYTKKNKTFELE